TSSFDPTNCRLSPVVGSTTTASCTVSVKPHTFGTVTITGDYEGDPGHFTSYGSGSLTANLRSTTTSISCTPTSVVVNWQASTCTVTVTDTTTGAVITPTGLVSFTSSGTGSFSFGSCILNGGGATAGCSINYAP